MPEPRIILIDCEQQSESLELKKEAIRYYLSGHTIISISRKVNLHQDTVSKILKSWGIKKFSTGHTFPKKQD